MGSKIHNETYIDVVGVSQCGNFTIFLSLRFFVKSILWILKVQIRPFNTFIYDFLHLLKFTKLGNKRNKSQIPIIGKKGSFRTSKFSKIDFT